ncbi:MAG: SDR family NAD(P)-dependent oxidoreductase, partial [Deltaproteobacteria bacterium]|nr:SDR family NAD(P)-dependent oxidoreductase [Deltaproteobacteria bacterium]
WDKGQAEVRSAGVSAFGFGGTNFHVVLEEYVPGRLQSRGARITVPGGMGVAVKAPLRGALVIAGATEAEMRDAAKVLLENVRGGRLPEKRSPLARELRAAHRLVIDWNEPRDLDKKLQGALRALEGAAGLWKALRSQGIFYCKGPAPKVAFLYTGQGSQYVNMVGELRDDETIVREVFDEADEVMAPLLGEALSAYIYVDPQDETAVAEATKNLMQTAITQPAVLATDQALTKLMGAYGIAPDMVMGHSLGEYGALVAAGALPFADALEAVSARGREMTKVSVEDNGLMAAVFAPTDEVQEILKSVDGYVVIANINSDRQAVIGGATAGVEAAIMVIEGKGYRVMRLPVSHAFHTRIVEPASGPLQDVLRRLDLQPPKIPVVANTTGRFYPMRPGVKEELVSILGDQISSPVQFVKGLKTLYDAGCRVFVEMGPKRALQGFVEEVLGDDEEVLALFSNHPKQGDRVAFNHALCGLYAAGLGVGEEETVMTGAASGVSSPRSVEVARAPVVAAPESPRAPLPPQGASELSPGQYHELGHIFAEFIDKGLRAYAGGGGGARAGRGSPRIVITGAGVGLPGLERVFDDRNVERLLTGQQLIGSIPQALRQAQIDKRVVRLVKDPITGSGTFVTLDDASEAIKLAGRPGKIDLFEDFGYPKDRTPALDITTQVVIGAGLQALRDAGIPLVRTYKTTSKGTHLPDRWMLPESLRDDTGVVFASAFGGYESFADEMNRYYADRVRRERLSELEALRQGLGASDDLDGRITVLRAEIEATPYTFERRFLFKILGMGHAQFAEYIGARGPNTQVNSACASGSIGLGVAHDWLRTGRCRRVIVLSGDTVTADNLLEWIGAGFLASGAAATDEVVEDAALPFDRRRHGLIMGMGGAAVVLENGDAAAERGVRPISELLDTTIANSAFHGSRLDPDHVTQVVEDFIARVERRWGISRQEIAEEMVFVSHETYTPARGGSAAAEVDALRKVFGSQIDKVVVANTKGLTGHAMATGIEDVLAVKTLETGIVPPVPNYKEVDPDLGVLNLSRGGRYPVKYALRLAAGFGSQVAVTLQRLVPSPDGRRPSPDELGFAYRTDRAIWESWLADATGYDAPEIEVVKMTLRVKEQGPPRRAPRRQRSLEEFEDTAPVASRAGAPADLTAVGRPTASYPPALGSASRPASHPATVTGATVTGATVAGATTTPATAALPAVALSAVTPPLTDPVVEKVLAIIAEQTGYPTEMLDLELDLEADLGIDTVKQAETFAAVREAYQIEGDESVQLRDFPTIISVVEFVRDRRPDLVATPVAPATGMAASLPTSAAASPLTVTAGSLVEAKVIEIVAAQTGYPPDMLDLDLDLEADLGIDTVKQAETFAAVREAFDIESAGDLQLRDFPTMKHVVQFVYDHKPELAASMSLLASDVASETAAPGPEAGASGAGDSGLSGSDPVVAKVVEIVAAQTGYPPDMLDLDLDLEADLGIDTVKQAETFAAVREAFGVESAGDLQLRDFPTMKHVVEFVYDHKPELRPLRVDASDVALVSEASAPVRAADPSAAPSGDGTSGSTDPVVAKVVEIIAEQTGYPPDMLDLDLDLEADLGIDTVKQAETFAAVREAFGVESAGDLQLRDFPTMKHVVEYVYEHRPELRPGAVSSVSSVSSVSASVAGVPEVAGAVSGVVASGPRGSMEAAAAIPRRLPTPVLRPPLSLCKATGVELQGRRVIVMHDLTGIGEVLERDLEAQGVTVLSVRDHPDAETLRMRLDGWIAEGPIAGVYWLSGLDPHPDFATMVREEFKEGLRVRVKLLYATMRALYEEIKASGTFLMSAVRLGGRHGYDEAGATLPFGGAITGFTKSYKHERPDVLVKAVDFAGDAAPEFIAEALVAETLHDPGAVEIGREGGDRWTIAFREMPLDEPEGMTLDADSVFVITGAAGSIVSAITVDLAEASSGTFYLLDLTPTPDPKDPDLLRFATDREGLKREIFERLKASGQRATPKLVDRELAGLERQRSALMGIEAIQAAGGRAEYRSVNLMDGEAVATIIDEIRERHGRVDVLVHAAGLEISRFLPDKEPKEFDLVFDVKVDGWYNLLHAMGDMPLRATVTFSSIAGRFGNGGQADYSSANDLLCKTTSSFRTGRPKTRGVAIDWTAWAGIGMAARGSIPRMMEIARIDMLPPEAGIPMVRRELTFAPRGAEIIVAQGLGIMLDEFDEGGGLKVAAVDAAREAGGARSLAAHIAGMDLYSGLLVETELDPTTQPFLFDHQIDGTPVLPGVMGIEAFAEVAKVLFPTWHVAAVEEVSFLAPFKFYRDAPRKISLRATFYRMGDGDVLVDAILVGARKLPNAEAPVETTHFSAKVRLCSAAPSLEHVSVPKAADGAEVTREAIYAIYFHGPAYQVLEKAWRSGDSVVGLFPQDLPDDQKPSTSQEMFPRLIEFCFQTAGIWEIGQHGVMGLPMRVDSVSVLRDVAEAEGRLVAIVTPRREGDVEIFDALVADEAGQVFVKVSGYRTIALSGAVDAARRAPLEAAMR